MITKTIIAISLILNIGLMTFILLPMVNNSTPNTNNHMHADFDIPLNSTNVPTIKLKSFPDDLSGYNVQIITTNFEFAPQKVNLKSANYNEGHAHLFINSKKISRIYSNWIQIPQESLTLDKNEILVSLNSNTHEEYHYGKEAIMAKLVLTKDKQKIDNSKLSMNQFADLIDGNKEIVILDVRTPQEFGQGRIPNSINIDLQNPNFKSEIEKLDKSKKYAIYCRSGNRSLSTYNQMLGLGFVNLSNASEGFTTWEYLKLPVQK